MFGVPKVSGYLFVRTFTKDGKISTMPKENLASQEAVIVDIPDYDKNSLRVWAFILRKKRILLSW